MRQRHDEKKKKKKKKGKVGEVRLTSFSRQHRRVDVIFNKVSGRRKPDADSDIIQSTLQRSFERVVTWHTTEDKCGKAVGEEAIADGATVLIACGGDGTVTGVATAIQKRVEEEGDGAGDLMLGVVPRGTANALCNALDIPGNVKRAAEMIATGCVRRIDMAQVWGTEGKKRMLLLAGIGLEAETVKGAPRAMKRALGALAYGVAGIRSIWKQEGFEATVIMHDVLDGKAFAKGQLEAKEMRLGGMVLKGVTVANAAPATSVLAQGVGTVRPDDGLVEVVCVASQTPWGMMRTMLLMLRSALLRRRETRGTVFATRARRVSVQCDPPQRVVVDGEPCGTTPVTVQLGARADAVRVIAPKAGAVNRRRRHLSRALIRLWRNARGAALLAVAIVALRRARA
ncbi:hypothetical protein BWQ96_09323 [Gracilariopsis chorda]|uniref:DAGKc domain-containing protein n=1 Tax=Gracilariopsis chorda TaxID=448386 RepID=A0A2V3IG13_9FLOR|nr:hypothetical protein BWQ96_09323 [Gracilariopsis chorda]|eukprot:PXF40968.1 hypothetical protein BWQ96_09323 [Gracilariopsis chorda]